jgi:hypothetical protein
MHREPNALDASLSSLDRVDVLEDFVAFLLGCTGAAVSTILGISASLAAPNPASLSTDELHARIHAARAALTRLTVELDNRQIQP